MRHIICLILFVYLRARKSENKVWYFYRALIWLLEDKDFGDCSTTAILAKVSVNNEKIRASFIGHGIIPGLSESLKCPKLKKAERLGNEIDCNGLDLVYSDSFFDNDDLRNGCPDCYFLVQNCCCNHNDRFLWITYPQFRHNPDWTIKVMKTFLF